MHFDEYQKQAIKTNIYPNPKSLRNLAMELGSEAGEVLGKVKKVYRDDGGCLTNEAQFAIMDELGDVLWGVANLAEAIGVALSTVARRNSSKLVSRALRGELGGSGDGR